MIFHQEHNVLNVLIKNTLYFISDINNLSPSVWSWSPNDILAKSLTISKLSVNDIAYRTAKHSFFNAVGCYMDENRICTETVGFYVDLFAKSVYYQSFKSISPYSFDRVVPVIRSSIDAKVAYFTYFQISPRTTVTTDETSVTITYNQASLITDRPQQRSEIVVPMLTFNTPHVFSSFSLAHPEGHGVVSAVSICGDSNSDSKAVQAKVCYVIAAVPKTQSKGDEGVKLEILLTASGDDVNIWLHRSQTQSDVVLAVGAASLTQVQTPAHSQLRVKTASFSTSSSSSEYELELPPNSSFKSIVHAHITVIEDSTVGISTVSKVLVQLSSGYTALFLPSPQTLPPAWTREEGLGSVLDAVLVEDVDLSMVAKTASSKQLLEKDISSHINTNARDILPTVAERWALQWLEILNLKALLQVPAPGKVMSRSKKVKFGYNKIAVVLASVSGHLVVLGLDAMTGDVLWTVEPASDSEDLAALASDTRTRLVATRRAVGISSAVVSLVLSSDLSNNTYCWQIDAATGAAVGGTQGVIIDTKHRISLPSAVLADAKLVSLLQHEQAMIMIIQDLNGNKHIVDFPSLTAKQCLSPPSTSSSSEDFFVHFLSEDGFTSLKASPGAGDDSDAYRLSPVSSTLFPATEAVVAVAYPSASDAIHSKSSVLGDDSVLLKYLNPNIVLFATVHPAQAASPYFSPSAPSSSPDNDSSPSPSPAPLSTLTLTLLDTLSGKTVQKIVHENGAAPVYAAIVENNIVATYWNCKAKRTELSSISLFEGLLDKFALNPLAVAAPGKSSGSGGSAYCTTAYCNVSAFSAPTPLAMQKTYILPRTVRAVHVTRTAKGIAHKNILLALGTGQLYSLDPRLVHPRRPLSDPSPAEKEEGLTRYQPTLLFNPQNYLTLDEEMYLTHASKVLVVSAATRLESTSLVLTVWGLDVHVNIATPSQGFDSLASDFNRVLLSVILLALAAIVLVLRRYAQRKQLLAMWA